LVFLWRIILQSKKEIIFISLVIILVVTAFALYFSTFNGKLSHNPSDWGSFGSYLAGALTFPLSILSLYFIYKTYKKTEETYQLEIFKKDLDLAHEAIKEASNFIESSLDNTVNINTESIGNEKISFRDINFNPDYAKALLQQVKSDDILNGAYRTSVGKPCLCLYDFLFSAEVKFGETETIRFYKIRYQWIINLHNQFKLDIIKGPKNKPSSLEIEKYFYKENSDNK